ncbi:hypothetical protein CLOP_g24132 [Closterium sp. NIES-67]|nr:hypothetical protein CLOP_g24132 [Closterium sp. NIES-67]
MSRGGIARFAAAETVEIAESAAENPTIEPWMDGLDYSVMDFAEGEEGETGGEMGKENGQGNGEENVGGALAGMGEGSANDGSAEARKLAFDYYDCGDDRARNYSHPHVAGAVESGRKFVMLAAEREQLTKARLHLGEAMTIAGLTNRTFVLTHVGSSRIGMDRDLPLCTYFNIDKITEHGEWITEDYLVGEAQRLQRPLRLKTLVLHKARHRCNRLIWRQVESGASFKEHPWARDILSFPQRIRCVKEEHRRHTQDASDALLEALKEDDVAAADVILVYKLADEAYFLPDVVGPAIRAIEFAPHLKAIAGSMTHTLFANSTPTAASAPATIPNSLREQLRRHPGQVRYLAVQWRTEYALLQPNMTARLMLRCTRGLIKKAWTAIQTKGLSDRVFLATDMHPDGRPVSMSFYGLEFLQQRIAKRVIQLLYSKLQPVSWTTVDPKFPQLDAGVQGILDKLVCLKATYFLYPPDQCGGHSSSFTRDIIGNRRKNRRAFPSEAWSLV